VNDEEHADTHCKWEPTQPRILGLRTQAGIRDLDSRYTHLKQAKVLVTFINTVSGQSGLHGGT